jgi:phage shock protein A
MGIFDRMGKVISSNVNALLDKAEDPKKNIEYIVAEMRDQIAAARKEIPSSMATEKLLDKKVQALDAESETWARRAELALKADDETLAREALVQKKRVVADRDRAEAMLAEAKSATLKAKAELVRMEAKLQEVEARKGTLVAQAQQARATASSDGQGGGSGGTAFDEFKRFEQKLERTEAEVAASREVEYALGGKSSATGLSREQLEARFAQLEHGSGAKTGKGGSDIDDELAALKQRVRVK